MTVTRLPFASPAGDLSSVGTLSLAAALAVLPALQALPSDMDRTAALAFAPAIFLASRLRQSASKAEAVDGWLLALAGALAVATLALNPQPAANLALTCAWIMTAFAAAAATGLARSPATMRLVLSGIAAGCVIGLIWARLGEFGKGPGFPLYGHARIFGLHMLAGAVATLALLARPFASKVATAATFSAAAAIWSGLLWSGGRGPLAGLATGIVLWLWFGTASERRRLALWCPLLLAAALLGSHLLGAQAGNLGWQRAVSSTINATDARTLSSERDLIWGQALREIDGHLWIGRGADAYRFLRPVPVGDQPHNVVLQWTLAFGAPAALALSLVLARRILRGLRTKESAPDAAALLRGTAAGAAAATVAGFFDGMFYHAVCFLPAAMLAAMAGATTVAGAATRTRLVRPRNILAAVIVGASGAVVALHAWLFFNLLAPPPASPQTPSARALRLFPSATYGVWRWIDAWTPSISFEERMEWLKWAQARSPRPSVFYYQEAQGHLERRDLVSASAALEQAAETSTGDERKRYRELIEMTHAVAASRQTTRPSP